MMRLLVLILAFAVPSLGVAAAVGFDCPENLQCGCSPSGNGELELVCPSGLLSSFHLNVRSNDLARLRCKGNPRWLDLLPGARLAGTRPRSLILVSCPPPGRVQTERLVEQLEARDLEYLAYEALQSGPSAISLSAFPELRYLVLSNNRIGSVVPDLIKGLPKLMQLELRNTNIRIPPNFFEKASSLRTLELSSNNLKDLKPGIFDGLTNIRLLNLWKNDLTELQSGVFRDLTSLVSLDVHQNKISHLTIDVLKDLSNLEVINFSSNNFSALPDNLFQNNPKLKIVKLMYNKANLTVLPRKFLKNLVNLKFVSFVRSGLQRLPEDLIWGSINIADFNLNKNYLTALPAKLLQDAIELSTFAASFNDLKKLPDGFFSNTRKLRKLDLSKNHLTAINERTLEGLVSLQELDMEDNDLTFIHFNAFNSLEELKVARFANNKLTLRTGIYDIFGHISPFQPCTSLEELYLSYNNITEIYSDWTTSSARLRELDLSYNLLDYLQTDDLQFVSKSVSLDLRYNSISQVNLERLERVSANKSFVESRYVHVRLEENPIHCDCDLYSLLRYVNKEMSTAALNYMRLELGGLSCSSPDYMSGRKLTELRTKKLKCLIQSSYSRPGDPCGSDSPCDCWLRPADRALILDCAAKNLTRPPPWIDARTVERIELDLAMNRLEAMPDMNVKGYQKVRTLNLSRNNIDRVHEKLISPNLEILNLDGNNLTYIDLKILRKFSSNSSLTSKLTLHGNPWYCDCSTYDLFTFIQSNSIRMPELLRITCSNTNVSLSSISLSELCTSNNDTVILVCSLVCLLGLLVGGGVALYFRYQRQIKVWLFSKSLCLCLVSEEEIDRDKRYDAFISYSHKDEEFVVKELVGRLEEGPRPYRLCIHVRDWLAGEWIPTQIARSVEESKRTIVVLSANFIESVWGRLEFQVAHKQALSERRARVIVVLYGDIGPTEKLDPELRAYLQMNTYVKWGDPWFWQKLRYAMPHSYVSPITHSYNKTEEI
ncbi:PREDICTED: protein toll-like [Ceratosolen solmsi marchali]|uniref:Protein toll-like n=1 Tax=Ceratosolen solmsi marchali TaxID=326594 RepID=A0AAJ6YXN5_9HYME|nr:PREDICTED: protein toll-like [Ceratosolen solmsi marchali]